MRTPDDKRITLTYYSHPMKDLKMRWKAQLVFEPGSSDEAPAEVTMNDGEGTPVAEAVFELAGQRIAIRDGKGAIRCGDFAKGKHEPAIWVYRKGQHPVPGVLTFE